MQRIQQIVLQKSFYTVYAELSTYIIIIMWISVVDSRVAYTLNVTRDQNDILSLKAVRRDVITNLKRFGARDTSDPISMVAFAFTMRCHFIRLELAPFTYFRLAKYGWAPFAERRIYGELQSQF